MPGLFSPRARTPWILVTLVVLSVAVAEAKQPYRLDAPSNFQEGCFAPCMCPILLLDGLRGTFATTPLGTDGTFEVFAVRNVRWRIPGTPPKPVRGSGIYRIDRDAEQQRMQLDLFVGNDPVQHFDSGVVPAGAEFPDIAVAISLRGMFCYDVVFDVRAKALDIDPAKWPDELDPRAPRGAKQKSTWSALKSLYRD